MSSQADGRHIKMPQLIRTHTSLWDGFHFSVSTGFGHLCNYQIVPSQLLWRHVWHCIANFWFWRGRVSLIFMQLCSASLVSGVPGERSERLTGSKASVISAELSSLIPGLKILHAARPQLCLWSSLILSICGWDHEGTRVLHLSLSVFAPSLHH